MCAIKEGTLPIHVAAPTLYFRDFYIIPLMNCVSLLCSLPFITFTRLSYELNHSVMLLMTRASV